MKTKNTILIEGLAEQELLQLTEDKEFQALIFSNTPIVFTAGTSEILGQFGRKGNRLSIILSHIDGGGEGVLLKLMNLFRQFAKAQNIQEIEWTVHAVDCPRPNPKLKRILALKGFEVVQDPRDGLVYRQNECLSL